MSLTVFKIVCVVVAVLFFLQETTINTGFQYFCYSSYSSSLFFNIFLCYFVTIGMNVNECILRISYLNRLRLHATCIHNYITLQPFSQDCNLASRNTYVLCVNFIHEWQDLQFKVDAEGQIFLRDIYMAIYFTYSQRFCQKSVESKSLKKYFFIFTFSCLTQGSNRELLRL